MSGQGSVIDRSRNIYFPHDMRTPEVICSGAERPDLEGDHSPPFSSTDRVLLGIIASGLYSRGAVTEVWRDFP